MLRSLVSFFMLASLASACAPQGLRNVTSAGSAPAEIAFGSVTVGEQKFASVTVANTGAADFEIVAIEVGSPFTATSKPAAVAIGKTASFELVFTPTAGQAYQQTLTIKLTATDTPTLTVKLTGTGITGPACTATSCGAGQACCDDQCVDIQNNTAHCGGCGACAQGDICTGGSCSTPARTCDDLTAPCDAGKKCCNHECVAVGPTGLCPCTGPGNSTVFGAGTIIIPMDACYQRGVDILSLPSYCNAANSKATADDAPLKAYGLVFFLLRHQVTVYMAIDPDKRGIDDQDLTLTSFVSRKTAVDRYDWATRRVVPLADQSVDVVSYRGAPFIIDSSQHDRVLQLLAEHADFAQFRAAGNITIHVANKSFPTTVAKQIGAVPSRIALLQVPTTNQGDSPTEILKRYLASAGLDFPGAGGTPSAPGQIYDVLQESDFLPDYANSKLKAGGYRLLWAPHWEGGTSNTPAQLATIGAFVSAGNDLFAECAAIGTLEGFQSTIGGWSRPGSAATRFMTPNGMVGNVLSVTDSGSSGPFVNRGLTSPFAQRGDFPFLGFFGRITDFNGLQNNYYSDVVRLITAKNTNTDLYAFIDLHKQGKGTVVYLAGHDYSLGGNNKDHAGVTAGSRLVLNTMFSLGTNNSCE